MTNESFAQPITDSCLSFFHCSISTARFKESPTSWAQQQAEGQSQFSQSLAVGEREFRLRATSLDLLLKEAPAPHANANLTQARQPIATPRRVDARSLKRPINHACHDMQRQLQQQQKSTRLLHRQGHGQARQAKQEKWLLLTLNLLSIESDLGLVALRRQISIRSSTIPKADRLSEPSESVSMTTSAAISQPSDSTAAGDMRWLSRCFQGQPNFRYDVILHFASFGERDLTSTSMASSTSAPPPDEPCGIC
ncbi:hypothetical protein GE09DRAFT_752355 [Coniochaeta sp. 2T2.1]|nr:hypothetical protein GE09DRAFT_752355 [Coniochaeta sp. 2T2.1]